jgi:hypothetical protein
MTTPATTGQAADAPPASAMRLPRWLRWWLGATSLALCLAILALWGTLGPSYLLDLVTAYCF